MKNRHRMARIRKGRYNYRGINLLNRAPAAREWVALDADSAAIEYAPTRRALVAIVDKLIRQNRIT